jgi:hypothetical protein
MTPAPGLTEAGTCKTIQAGSMTIYDHEVGQGEPVLALHPYGPGTTAWIIFPRTRESISQHHTGHPDYEEARQKSVSMHGDTALPWLWSRSLPSSFGGGMTGWALSTLATTRGWCC